MHARVCSVRALPAPPRPAHPHLTSAPAHPPTPHAQEVVGALVALLSCLPPEAREERVLPTYRDLCRDAVWSVRQECAAELAAVAAALPRAAFRDALLPLHAELCGDASAWVQTGARRQCGPLLARVHPDDAGEGERMGVWVGVGGCSRERECWWVQS